MVWVQGFTRRTANGVPTLYVRAHVRLPRFGSAERVFFRVDTGATLTCLHPLDWVTLIPRGHWDLLRPTRYPVGIAG